MTNSGPQVISAEKFDLLMSAIDESRNALAYFVQLHAHNEIMDDNDIKIAKKWLKKYSAKKIRG